MSTHDAVASVLAEAKRDTLEPTLTTPVTRGHFVSARRGLAAGFFALSTLAANACGGGGDRTPVSATMAPSINPSPSAEMSPSPVPSPVASPEVSPSPAEPMSAKAFYEAAKKAPSRNLQLLTAELNRAIQLDPKATSDLTSKRLHDILSNCFNNKNDGEIECTGMVQAFFADLYRGAETPEAKAADLQFGIDVAHLGLAEYPSFDAQLKRTLGLTSQ
jgi:hypothetical protein